MCVRQVNWYQFQCDHALPHCWGSRSRWGTSLTEAVANLTAHKLNAESYWTVISPLDGNLVEMEASGLVVCCPACMEDLAAQEKEAAHAP